jgi:hypothetical protein
MARERRVRLQPVRVWAEVDDLAEARVRDSAVVALEVVLDGDLPVGIQRVAEAAVELERVQSGSTYQR